MDSTNGNDHTKVVKGLLLLSILILVVTLYSFCDEFYSKVADADNSVTLNEQIDAILHIIMVSTLVFLEIAFVYTRLKVK